MVNSVLIAALGAAAVATLTTTISTVDGRDVCRVHAKPSPFPVEAIVKVEVKTTTGEGRVATNLVKKPMFYARINNLTHLFAANDPEKQKYIAHRWPTGI